MSPDHLPLLTYPIILVAVFASQMCLPVPAVIFLMVGGALGVSGQLSILTIIPIATAGSLVADYVWFEAGRWWGGRTLRILCGLSSDPRYCVQRARDFYTRWGPRTLVIAKFVPGLDGLMPPLCGLERAKTIEFLLFDMIGSILWSTAYCLTGYLFASRINAIAETLQRIGSAFALIALIPVLCYILWRAWELIRTIHQLRIRTISPRLLQQKLQAGERVVIVDLILCEDGALPVPGPAIPGAIRINPARLRTAPRVFVPNDVQVVLYCSSPNELTSARVAISLRHKGVRKLWVLQGGFHAWLNQELPVTSELGDPEKMMQHLGIVVKSRPHL